MGDEFLDELERTIRRIQLNPDTWRKISEHRHKCRLRHFPYAVVYSIEAGEIVIAAVMDLRRKPDYWKLRV